MEGSRDIHKMNGLTKLFILSSFVLPLAVGAVEVDGIVATVGSKSILRSEVLSATGGVRDKVRFEEARNALIERELILRAAEASKMTLQDWVVDDRIRSIIEEHFGGDRNRLIEALAKEKRTYADWRQSKKEEMIVGAMCWNAVTKNVTASPSEMSAEYASHPERYQAGSLVSVSVILLKPEDASKRAEVEELVKAESFAAAARKYSAGSHAKDGGVWKDVDPVAVFKPEICTEIARLKIGETSSWLDIGGWSFLLRKDAATVSRVRSFAEAYDDIKANVIAENSRRLHAAWIERLKADTFIRIY